MQNFRDLKVWEKAHRFTLAIYKATQTFPRQEMYGLTSQIRRASSSIPANLAEGCGRGGDPDFARFLWIAMARPASWNIICCWLGTWNSWPPQITTIFRRLSLRSNGCWRPSYSGSRVPRELLAARHEPEKLIAES